MRLRWVSAANSVCGAPKPRNAPLGGVLVRRRPGADAHVRAAVRAARVERAAGQHDGGQRAVRAAVHDDLDVLGDERAVAPDAGPVADDGRVALGRGRDVLVAVVDHAHRPLGLAGEQGRMQADDVGELLLAAEAATGLGLDDPRGPVIDETQAALERAVQVVRALQRARDRDPAALRRARRSSRCSRCTAAPGGRPGTRPRGSRSAPAKAASRSSPRSIVYWAKVWSDASGSKVGGSGVVRGRTRRRASRRVALSGAAMSASGSA